MINLELQRISQEWHLPVQTYSVEVIEMHTSSQFWFSGSHGSTTSSTSSSKTVPTKYSKKIIKLFQNEKKVLKSLVGSLIYLHVSGRI